ncbi:MAG: ABC transporter permease [Spirochaetota bacterium]
MMAFVTLLKTELRLALRSMDMVLFAVLMPVVVLIVVGLIYGETDAENGMVTTTFGAFLAIGIAAVGLMGLPLGLAEYRHRKVLKRLQVTPAHPALLLSVQLIAQAAVSIVSAALVIAVAVLAFGYELGGSLLTLAGTYVLVMLSIFAIGLVIASTARDIKRAGMIASLVYFPMLIFSGTTVPFPVFPELVQRAALILPLRHGIELLTAASQGSPLGPMWPRIGLLAVITVTGVLVSVKAFRWDME